MLGTLSLHGHKFKLRCRGARSLGQRLVIADPVETELKSTNGFVGDISARINENFETVRKNLRRAAEYRKTQYDIKVKLALFDVGDTV